LARSALKSKNQTAIINKDAQDRQDKKQNSFLSFSVKILFILYIPVKTVAGCQ